MFFLPCLYLQPQRKLHESVGVTRWQRKPVCSGHQWSLPLHLAPSCWRFGPNRFVWQRFWIQDNNDNNNEWLLYSANLSIQKTQCASTHHSRKYTHRHKHNPRTYTHTHTMICLHLWKCLLKEESFELGFEVREGGKILQAGRQRIPDNWNNETGRTVTNRLEIVDFQKFVDQRVREVWYMQRQAKR